VTIQNHDLPATYLYAAAPKLEQSVFLLAALTGWQDLGLLPGPAQVYLEGAFTGRSVFDPFVTADTLRFSLGRDPRIVVERKAVKEFTSKKLLGGQQVKTLHFDLVVKNTRSRPVEVVLEDQVPLSKNRDIEVKIEELSGGAQEAETGKVTWKLSLAAGATEKRRLAFSVKYPKDRDVGGL
jgi:uncharacterized protein (TIGR02231 family)